MKRLLVVAIALMAGTLSAQTDSVRSDSAEPAGVMRLILGGRPSLGQAERDSLVTLFRDLYKEQLAKSDSAQRRLRPVEMK